MTGQAMYRYSQTPDGKIDLFPMGYKFHPRHGNKLELVTPNLIKDMDRKAMEAVAAQKREQERQRQILVQKAAEEVAAQERERQRQTAEAITAQERERQRQTAEAEDSVVRVDRSMRVTYPDGPLRVAHPELEATGPDEFDVRSLKQWLHPRQRESVKGEIIYIYLDNTNTITDFLNLQDLVAIQSRGLKFFRRYFANKDVFAWKSVVMENRQRANDLAAPIVANGLLAPFLREYNNKVVLEWCDVTFCSFDTDRPSFRFAK